jgi:hypothetical protein
LMVSGAKRALMMERRCNSHDIPHKERPISPFRAGDCIRSA